VPIRTLNLELLNLREQQSYPLTPDASGRDETGTFSLPKDLLLDLDLPVEAGWNLDPEKFFLKALTVDGTGVRVEIGYDGGSEVLVAATAAVSRQTHVPYAVYRLSGQGDFADSVGHVIVGRIDDATALPPGHYTFDLDGGGLEVCCVRPNVRGVSSLTAVNGAERSQRLYGDVELVAGTNVRLTVTEADGVYSVRIDAIEGEGLTDECECDEPEDRPCIKTISGVGPDSSGNVAVVGDECLTVETLSNGIRIVDTCSSPCCGCDELQALVRELQLLSNEAVSLRSYADRLQAETTGFNQAVLGSQLGTRGCSSCDDDGSSSAGA
jgi:hypothetical protein